MKRPAFLIFHSSLRPLLRAHSHRSQALRAPAIPFWESFLVIQTFLVVVLCSWSIGGKASWVPYSLFGSSLLAWVPFWFGRKEVYGPAEVRERERGVGGPRQRNRSGSATWGFRFLSAFRLPASVFSFLPLGCFALYSVICYLNPSHTPNPAGGWLPREGWISWLPTTFDRLSSLPHTLIYLGILQQVGVLGARLTSRRARRRLVLLLVCNGLVLALVGAYFFATGAKEMLDFITVPGGYFFATFVYKNHWAAFALLNAALAAGLGFWAWDRAAEDRAAEGLRLFSFTAFVLLLFTIPLPGSRAGLLLSVPLLLAVLVTIAWRIARSPGRSARARTLLLSAFAVVLSAGGGFLVYLMQPSLEALQQKTAGQIAQAGGRVEAPMEMRLQSGRDAFRMAADRPLWGWGQGSFLRVFPLYQGKYVFDDQGRQVGVFDAAHCDYAQFPAEVGYLGFAILLLPVLYRLFKHYRGPSPVMRWAAVGVTLILVCAIGEFPFQNPAVTLLVGVLLAL